MSDQSTKLPPELLERPEMRAALSAHDFGTVFLLARSEAGISYSRIAAACDIKPERVGTLARGRGRITTYEKIALIADVFRIPGHMVGLAPREWETETDTDDSLPRREFLKASAAAGAGLAVGLPEPARLHSGRRVDASVPDQLRRRTCRLRALDDILGGGDTYRVYLGEYQETRHLVRHAVCSEPVRRSLLSVLAEQAQQAGWAAFDGGHHAEARGLYEASHRAASEAGDSGLAGNALAFLAYQALGRDPRTAVEIAARSCATAGPDAAPGVRALLHERLAWAQAVGGNAAETEYALATAREALEEAADAPQPDWSSWVDSNELDIMTGRCWTELKRPLRAVPLLEKALGEFDDNCARDKSLYLSWLADSYLAAGEVEQAAAVTGHALDLSSGVASVRPRQRLAPVLQQLGDHRVVPAVADVLEKARA
ncbi:twin-arginine translocation signal domain-containing protein [Streptomyces sp. NPDC026673]|uniref:twin-arginine translocation signal domain-containing protein n=1 Tax=Streptomyces sp. NPDC026673 TaxID=3155724 RepID=UPI00340B90B8